jgi:hypothetical protein
LLITLAIQCGIQPVMTGLKAQALPLDVMHSAFADRFKMLHGISSMLYLIQSVLGIFLVIKLHRACSSPFKGGGSSAASRNVFLNN